MVHPLTGEVLNSLSSKTTQVTDAILLAEEPGKIVFVNRAIEQLIGYTAGELIGRSLSVIFPEAIRRRHESALNTFIQSGESKESLEVVLAHKDGSELAAEMSVSTQDYNGKTTLTAHIRALPGGRQKVFDSSVFQSLIETQNDILITLNTSGFITYSSPAIQFLTGKSAASISGSDFLSLFSSEEHTKVHEAFEASLSRFSFPQKTIARMANANGTELLAELELKNKLNDSSINAVVVTLRTIDQSETTYDEIEKFYHLSDDIFCIIHDQYFCKVNPAFAEVTGYTLRENEKVNLFDLIFPADAEQVKQTLALLNHSRKSVGFECRIQNKYGTIRWLHWNVYSGNQEGDYLAIIKDTTLVRHSEMELKEKSEQYRLMFYNNPVPTYIYDTESLRILAVNDAAIQLFGYAKEEFKKLKMPDLVPSHLRPGLTNMLGKAMLNTRMQFTNWQYIRKDGEIINVELNSQAIPYKGFSARLISVFDVSNRREEPRTAEEQTEASIITLLENTDECMWSMNMEYKLLVANTTFRRTFSSIFGFEVEEAVNRLDEIPYEIKEAFNNIVAQAVKGEKQVYEKIFEVKGKKRCFEIHINPVIRDGITIAVSCFARDISDRHKLEDALQAISTGISTYTGSEFFQSLAGHLYAHFGADMVIIGQVEPNDKNVLNTLAVYNQGFPAENISYQLDGSPIGLVAQKGLQTFPDDVRKFFPEDDFLRLMDIESFIGAPLLNQQHECTGVIAMLYKNPVKNTKLMEYVLQIFASRAAAELERLHAMEVVYQSEANLNALLENAQEAIWAVDRDYRITVVNEAFKRLFSFYYGVELKQGMRMIDHFPESARAAWMNRFQRALRGEQFIMERHYDFGDDYMDTEVSINPIIRENGTITGVSYFSRDITHRKRAEEAIRKSEYRYRSLVETMHEGLIYADRHEVIQFVNRQLCEMCGYSEQELIGQKYEIFVAGPEMIARLHENTQKRKEGFASKYEILFAKKDGETFWGLVNGIPLTDSNGKYTGSMATITDITDLKRTEEDLKATNMELNTFVYKSSHDLKGPLSSIMGLTELALKEVEDSASLNYLEMIRQSAVRLDKILLDLLDNIRIKEGVIKPEKIIFPEILTDILESLSHSPGYERLIYSQEIELTKDFYCDKNVLRSVMQNLIDNAIKYQDYKKENICIRLGVHENERGVEIVISDNGLGISQAAQAHIFDMFYRAHLETKGTGLGLYIVKNAVNRLKGNIKLESQEGVGSTFKLILPNQETEPEKKNKEHSE
jgi:PAS domain S-box-containing protein